MKILGIALVALGCLKVAMTLAALSPRYVRPEKLAVRLAARLVGWAWSLLNGESRSKKRCLQGKAR